MPNPTRTCTECGQPAKRLTCGADCAKERKRRRNREIYRKQVANGEVIRGHHHEKTCQLCGETFTARASARFCSHTCRDLNNLATGQLARATEAAHQVLHGAITEGDRRQKELASLTRAMRRLARRKQAQLMRDPLESPRITGQCEVEHGTCPRCAAPWLADPRAQKVYCTRWCARAAKDERRNRRGHAHLQHRGLVFMRDDFTCWICGNRTSETYSRTDPWSPTLDHYHPASLGGSDEPENLRTAHMICNARRGAPEVPIAAPLVA